MKKKDKNAIAEMSKEELGKHIAETRSKLSQLSVSRYTKQVKNVRETKNLRRRLAVMLTFQRQKELSGK